MEIPVVVEEGRPAGGKAFQAVKHTAVEGKAFLAAKHTAVERKVRSVVEDRVNPVVAETVWVY